MGKEIIANRISKLREKMLREKIDYFLIPTADFHGSEYVNEYFKTREFFSGFTGSAGSLLIGKSDAYLWTDGRYFIQAALELEDTEISLMKQREPGVPTLEEFLQEKMEAGGCLAFDGRLLSYKEARGIEKRLEKKQAVLRGDMDPAEDIWTDRPAFPAGKAYLLEETVAGKSSKSKIDMIREELKETEAESFFLTKLDDIMWLCNMRGCDVQCNPVAMAYFYLSMDRAVLFLQKSVWTEEIKKALKQEGILLQDYWEVEDFLEMLSGEKILIDEAVCSYQYRKVLGEKCFPVSAKNPTLLKKAIKNEIEQQHMREYYLKDSVAVTKFIYWLKKNIGKIEITEITAADRLEEFRREIPGFLDLSFPTISGYKANAAMMHYEATPESFAILKQEGFLLVDSGAQYLGATTDVTRTISLGALSEKEREYYNLVAAGMIQMTNASFLYGCTGRNLDILAREPLWEKGIDYKCGTGHGVGYILNVHEGPQALRWQYQRGVEEAVFEEGMDVTNEPGVYIENEFGIRIENVMLTQKKYTNESGTFMGFETLTFVPLDREALDARFLTLPQKERINAYQQEVYKRVSPYLDKEEKIWLKNETESI